MTKHGPRDARRSIGIENLVGSCATLACSLVDWGLFSASGFRGCPCRLLLLGSSLHGNVAHLKSPPTLDLLWHVFLLSFLYLGIGFSASSLRRLKVKIRVFVEDF